jgi:hypothetical protein
MGMLLVTLLMMLPLLLVTPTMLWSLLLLLSLLEHLQLDLCGSWWMERS